MRRMDGRQERSERSRLMCFARCGWGGASPFEVVYHCPQCGALLEVEHDVEALREAGDGRAWRKRFDSRLRRAAWAGSGWGGGVSGVWGKREWVLPDLPEEERIWRFFFLVGATIHTMASGAKLRYLAGGRCDPTDVEGIVRRLTAFLAAGFRAPAEDGEG